MTKTVLERVEANVMADPNSGCWLWTGCLSKAGYGQMSVHGKLNYAHRISYEVFIGPIPLGLHIDHKCRVRACINPRHLEPVTHAENVRRGDAGKVTGLRGKAMTHCKNGHEFTEKNTYINIGTGDRVCRTCRMLLMRERRKSRKW